MMRLYMGICLLTYSHMSFANVTPQNLKNICNVLSPIAKFSMETRQSGISQESALKITSIAFKDNSLKTQLQQVIEDAYYYPLVDKQEQKDLLIHAYSVYFTNKCNSSGFLQELNKALENK